MKTIESLFGGSRIQQDEKDLEQMVLATERLQHIMKQQKYADLRNEREKATFSMMMKMNPDALTNIRKEFFARQDSITLDEFIYIIQKHLVNRPGEEGFHMETPEQREFGINMFELFKDIDVNGDGQLEWQEFTSFTVEKANLLNKRARLASIPHYYDTSDTLDASAKYRHRHDISRFVNLPSLGMFAMLEDHKNAVFLFNSRRGEMMKHTIITDSAPIAVESIFVNNKESIVTSGADMTLSTYTISSDPNRKSTVLQTWSTPGVQMALAYSRESKTLYSGATNGNIYSWDIHHRSLLNTLTGHSDIVMNLIVLQRLNNIASASLDKTLGVWDSHTNQEILRLYGHRKGVSDLTYNPNYRLMFSCGFEHDACVWSPFVKNLVYRLKGHHASLVGVQTVENTPEVITADTSGVFKLWDIRNFQCVQTFTANLTGQDTKDSSKLTCFFHTKLPSNNVLQKEEDSRIYAASKLLFSFDQARVVHEATSDYTNVFYMQYIPQSSLIITASERNVIVWDALVGSRMFTHTNITTDEISSCCLDDRKRKIVIGEVTGHIGVYNASNGQLMKTVHKSEDAIVVSLEYFDDAKRFIAGYSNGMIGVYDENVLEECHRIRPFEEFNRHSELLSLRFSHYNRTVATAEGSSNFARLWDYDSGKCDTELHVGYSDNSIILHIALLDPYPIVVTCDSTGNVLFWGSRGNRWQGLRIAGFVNQTPVSADPEVPIGNGSSANGGNGMKEGGSSKTNNDDAPVRVIPPLIASEDVLEKGIHKHVSRALSHLEKGSLKSSFVAPGSPQSTNATSRIRGLRASFNPLSEAFQVDPFQQAASRLAAANLLEESEKKWGKVSAAQCVCWDAKSRLLFTGDDVGGLRCYDINDMMTDLKVDSLVSGNNVNSNADSPGSIGSSNQARILGLCRSTTRNEQSALPPLFDEDHLHEDDFDAAHATLYLLGQPGNAMSYLGVKFSWFVTAHHDRIISTTVAAQYGILTSAADRLVRMWSFHGHPLGTLLQSVPVGSRSRSWDLLLDIDDIIQRENEELDELVTQAKAVANNPDKPDIDHLDFSGMQLGAESADFSRSVLRQRIEKTSTLLGLDFPTHRKPLPLHMLSHDHGGHGDHHSPTGHHSPNHHHGGAHPSHLTTHQGGGDDMSSIHHQASIASITTAQSITSKPSIDALREIKSTESAVDYDLKNKKMSYIQQKRKANKLQAIAIEFEKKTEERMGIRVSTANRTIREPSIWGATGDANNNDANSKNESNKEEEKQANDEFEKLLGAKDVMAKRDESSVNNDMYSLSTPSHTHVNASSLSARRKSVSHAAVSGRQRGVSTLIQDASDGPRTKLMNQSCSKYDSFHKLDALLMEQQHHHSHSHSHLQTHEQLLEIRARREKKQLDLLNDVHIGDNAAITLAARNRTVANSSAALLAAKEILSSAAGPQVNGNSQRINRLQSLIHPERLLEKHKLHRMQSSNSLRSSMVSNMSSASDVLQSLPLPNGDEASHTSGSSNSHSDQLQRKLAQDAAAVSLRTSSGIALEPFSDLFDNSNREGNSSPNLMSDAGGMELCNLDI